MSFSSNVKDELLTGISSSKHCKLAELAAIVIMAGRFIDDQWLPPEDNMYVSEKGKVCDNAFLSKMWETFGIGAGRILQGLHGKKTFL